jgi:hypothetical protein
MRKENYTNLRVAAMVTMVAALFLAITATTAAAASLQVESAVICEQVVDREPVDVGSSFSATVGKLYFFTKIVGAEGNPQVTHVWYYGDTERARVTLSVRASNWRTYSSKRIQAQETGAWRAEILDAEGNTLATARFEVVK